MKVTLTPEPISAEELHRRLLDARCKAADVYQKLVSAERAIGLTNGGPYNIVLRELEVLENLVDTALRYAESVADQVKREADRLAAEDDPIKM